MTLSSCWRLWLDSGFLTEVFNTIDEDGWLRVGDLAVLHDNGAIEIIERVDELKKLQNGEYIAPQKIEAIYVNVPLIE